MASGEEFYVRYYVGHKGKFGHEFLEFEFRPDGKKTSLEAFSGVYLLERGARKFV